MVLHVQGPISLVVLEHPLWPKDRETAHTDDTTRTTVGFDVPSAPHLATPASSAATKRSSSIPAIQRTLYDLHLVFVLLHIGIIAGCNVGVTVL